MKTNKGPVDVAVKTIGPKISEEDKIKLLQEAAIMGQFKHPNIIHLHGMVAAGKLVSILWRKRFAKMIFNRIIHFPVYASAGVCSQRRPQEIPYTTKARVSDKRIDRHRWYNMDIHLYFTIPQPW